MIRTLILLSPVYVSLFWIITFFVNRKNQSTPAKFLNVFMLIAFICFFGQFLFFAPYPHLFPYWEPFLAYLGSAAFPAYYIYFRLLTVDDKFIFRKHAKYLFVPILIATIYTVAIFLTPFDQYKVWIYNENIYPDSPYIQFLAVMRKIVKLTFVVLLIITFILNQGLLKKYAHKAEQYYSDINDGKFNNAHKLNYYLIFISLSSLIAHIVGRKLLLPSETIFDVIWLIFAISLFGIGYMGFTQKPLNPTYESAINEVEVIDKTDSELNLSQQIILKKLLEEFEKNKIYLDNQLNINDIVQLVGTNRTYISTIINQQYKQNFCSFVNGYRMEELERILIANPYLNNKLLAEQCGFGSFNSMKRTIESRSGQSVAEWKNDVSEKLVKIG